MADNEGSHPLTTDSGHVPGHDGAANGVGDLSDRTGHSGRAERHTPSGRIGVGEPVHEQRVLPARTSVAAVFALVFGLSALLAALTVILAPVALVLAIIGIILGIVGLRMAKRVGITGRGVAIGGLILAVLGLILSVTIVAGATTVLNNQNAVDRLDKQVQKLRDNLPAKVDIPGSK